MPASLSYITGLKYLIDLKLESNAHRSSAASSAAAPSSSKGVAVAANKVGHFP